MLIKPYYKGCNAILAAPGPSLTKEVVEIIREHKNRYAIFGVGDAYRQIDFLDELYACDSRWWKVHGKEVQEIKRTRKWCYDPEGIQYGAIKIDGRHDNGFSRDPNHIHFGSNSGYQALNLAYLWGCSKIILVGYNMQRVNNKSHFFEGRDPSLITNSPYNVFVKKFNTIQPDIRSKVINCTPNSALTMFKKSDLLSEL